MAAFPKNLKKFIAQSEPEKITKYDTSNKG